MPKVVGIKFDKAGKVYHFEAGNHEYREGDNVLVETARGLEFGTVASLPMMIGEERVVQPLKPIIRIATEEDKAQARRLNERKPETMKIAQEKIEKSGLDMKLVDAQYTFDGAKLILYFTADSRVDFRELVRELAAVFRVRIELRQIGSRDECKLKGGLGPCGRACCCSDHLCDFAHVTIKMAKNQNLSLNPGKISGLCGRLMCCLSYENNHYAETNKRMPKVGSEVETTDGKRGVAISINQLKETVSVKFSDKDTHVIEDYHISNLLYKNKQIIDEDDSSEDELKNLED